MLSFQELLKPGTPIRLCHFLEQAFQESKAVIVREIEQVYLTMGQALDSMTALT